MAELKDGDVLSDENYRRFAQKAIEKYSQKEMLIDAMMWSQIIGRYEKALQTLLAREAASVGGGGPVTFLSPEKWTDAKELLRRSATSWSSGLAEEIETFLKAVK